MKISFIKDPRKIKAFKFIESPFIILTIFFIALFIGSIAVVELTSYKFYKTLTGVTGLVNFIIWYIPELLLLYFMGLLLCNGRKSKRVIFYLLFAFFFMVYLSQTASIHMSNDLISVLAMENIHFIKLILHKRSLLLSLATFFLGTILFVIIMELFTDKSKRLNKKVFSTLVTSSFLLSCYLIFYNFYLLSTTEGLFYFFPNKQTPAVCLFNNFLKLNEESPEAKVDIDQLKKMGLNYNYNAKYPFLKKQIYSNPIQYPVKKDIKKPNIIILFFESMSAKCANCYCSEFEGLTPNIDRFAKDCMKVDNYYNHTAATCRGLPGQLASVYPFRGYGEWDLKGSEKTKNINYSSIPYILNKRGYETVFFCAENNPITSLLKNLKFQQIYNSERIVKEILKGKEKYVKEDQLNDESFLESFICYLKEKEKQDSPKPFFIGLYNVETHAYFRSPNNGVKYKNSDNDTLNSVHNLDKQFGKFYDYFRKSPYAKNTILILTADHAHYHGDPHYLRTLKKGSEVQFIDKVVLLIYNPCLELPKYYDAKMATSIDLAPTLFHMLGINNEKNNFMGKSLFEENKSYGIGAIRHKFYFVSNNKVCRSNSLTDEENKNFEAYVNYIKLFYLIESQNRVFPGETAKENGKTVPTVAKPKSNP